MVILITSVGTATSVNLIKYFKRESIYIIGTDTNPYGYTAGSQLVDEFRQIPLAVDDSYLQALQNIINEKNVDVLIPVNDNEVYILSKFKEVLECECIIPEHGIIELMRDKLDCSIKVATLGIPVPDILKQDNPSIKRILRDRIGVGSKGIKIIASEVNAPEYAKTDKFLQTYVEGEEYTVDVLADLAGNPVYIVPRKRMEVKNGVATKVRVEKKAVLIDYAKNIMEEFKIPGFSNIQFIEDVNNKFWFVEINYRFSGCGAATLAVAPDYLPTFMKIVKREKFSGTINNGVKWNSVVTRYYEEIVYEESIS